jgi:hypothetical protein
LEDLDAEELGELPHRRLVARRDVDRAGRARRRCEQEGARDVVDVDVVARLVAVAVDRDRPPLGRGAVEDRDDARLAVRVLPRPVDAASSTAAVPATFTFASKAGRSTERRTSIWAARWITTEGPASVITRAVSSSSVTSTASSSAPCSSAVARFAARPDDRSSRTWTDAPAASSASTTWEPMKPAPPVTTTFMSRLNHVRDRRPKPRKRRAHAPPTAREVVSVADRHGRAVPAAHRRAGVTRVDVQRVRVR